VFRRELLAPLGTPIHLGPTGAGAGMKLVAKATLAGLMGLVGEALADGVGLQQQRVIAALLDSPSARRCRASWTRSKPITTRPASGCR
jgi:3-hydroxyisobutyrate dehydrogenase-like beta-hydroxyacid dehydrogenase